jgi:prepilin-type N-terminal cleavage/methylation domain-containing protein
MGLRSRKGSGFTLIELLVVIVIICLIAALLLPAILKALCTARAGTAAHLIDQLTQAAKSYELDNAIYPGPAKGDDSKSLTYCLSQKGAKKNRYFDFPPDMLNGGNVVNPVYSDGDAPINIIYYRLNQKQGAGAPPSGGGAGQPPIMHPSSFDMWCAGCTYTSGDPKTLWGLNNWE